MRLFKILQRKVQNAKDKKRKIRKEETKYNLYQLLNWTKTVLKVKKIKIAPTIELDVYLKRITDQ